MGLNRFLLFFQSVFFAKKAQSTIDKKLFLCTPCHTRDRKNKFQTCRDSEGKIKRTQGAVETHRPQKTQKIRHIIYPHHGGCWQYLFCFQVCYTHATHSNVQKMHPAIQRCYRQVKVILVLNLHPNGNLNYHLIIILASVANFAYLARCLNCLSGICLSPINNKPLKQKLVQSLHQLVQINKYQNAN